MMFFLSFGLAIAGILFFYFILLPPLVVKRLSSFLLDYPTLSLQEQWNKRKDWGEIPEDWEELGAKKESFTSPEGNLVYWTIGIPETHTIVFLLHGAGQSHISMLRFIPYYLELGCRIIIPDHRGSGESFPSSHTYGIREAKDLSHLAHHIEKKQDYQNRIFHGESMGAATAIMVQTYLDKGPSNFIVADCPFSSMEDQIKYRVARFYPFKHFQNLIYRKVRDRFKLQTGEDLDQANPKLALAKTKTPTLLIHGDQDKYVPQKMSLLLASVIGKELGTFWSVSGGRHGNNWRINPTNYHNKLDEFYRQWQLKNKKEVGNGMGN